MAFLPVHTAHSRLTQRPAHRTTPVMVVAAAADWRCSAASGAGSRPSAGASVRQPQPLPVTQPQHQNLPHSCVSHRQSRRRSHTRAGSVGGGGSGGPVVTPTLAPPRICVVGGGVVGLTTALRIMQEFGRPVKVTVIADKWADDTTSAGAAGVWGPYRMSETPNEVISRLSADTHEHLASLIHSPNAQAAGVQLLSCHWLVKDEGEPPPFWLNIPWNGGPLQRRQLKLFDKCPNGPFRGGWFYQTVVCEGAYYMAWLRHSIIVGGGKLRRARLSSLQELLRRDDSAPGLPPGATSDSSFDDDVECEPTPMLPDGVKDAHCTREGLGGPFDAIVNCTGLGAADLVSDKEVYPIRGQILKVKAPWITQCYFADPFYIIPNRNWVVLGGTATKDDASLEVSARDRADIWEGCVGLMPSLKDAERVGDWVGLRPGRTQLRLDLEEVRVEGAGAGATVPVVHNYGHGGGGLTLAWGCAGDVVEMLRDAL